MKRGGKHSAEAKAKMAAARRGTKHRPEIKIKMSLVQRARRAKELKF